MNESDNQLLRRYLLGLASASEQESIEEVYFGSQSSLKTLLQVEDELIDDYFRADLDADENFAFIRNFLTTNLRKEKVQFTVETIRAIANSVSEEATNLDLGEFRNLSVTGSFGIPLRRGTEPGVTALAQSRPPHRGFIARTLRSISKLWSYVRLRKRS